MSKILMQRILDNADSCPFDLQEYVNSGRIMMEDVAMVAYEDDETVVEAKDIQSIGYTLAQTVTAVALMYSQISKINDDIAVLRNDLVEQGKHITNVKNYAYRANFNAREDN